LTRQGVRPTGWGTLLRWFAGVATLTLNVWESVARADAAGIVLHAVPPLLLILLAEAAPQYRRQFAVLAEDGPTAGSVMVHERSGPLAAESVDRVLTAGIDAVRTASTEGSRTAHVTPPGSGPGTTTDRDPGGAGTPADLRDDGGSPPVRVSGPKAVRTAVRDRSDRRSGPVAGKRSAGRSKAVSRSRPDVSDLLPVGRSVATELERSGRSLSRANVVAEFRTRGQSLSTDRAGALVERLRNEPHLLAVKEVSQ
jgi:hypothetical protein